jgi:hypothetical protein
VIFAGIGIFRSDCENIHSELDKFSHFRQNSLQMNAYLKIVAVNRKQYAVVIFYFSSYCPSLFQL